MANKQSVLQVCSEGKQITFLWAGWLEMSQALKSIHFCLLRLPLALFLSVQMWVMIISQSTWFSHQNWCLVWVGVEWALGWQLQVDSVLCLGDLSAKNWPHSSGGQSLWLLAPPVVISLSEISKPMESWIFIFPKSFVNQKYGAQQESA
jgi:hypothetical protein